MNFTSQFVANTYSAFSPAVNLTASVCQVNEQQVVCPAYLNALVFGLPLIILVLLVLMIVSLWKIFVKAGQPGWASIIPIYNLIVILQIIRQPIWLVILGFIPVANVLLGLFVAYGLAKAFGKDIGYTLGLIFLPFILYPMLAFGEAKYQLGEVGAGQ